MTTRTWNGASDVFTNGADWSPAGVPQSGDTAVINTGSVLASGQTFSGLGIDVQAGSGFVGALTMANSTIASNTSLTLNNLNAYGTGSTPTLALQGRNTNYGTLSLTGALVSLTFASDGIGTNGALINEGAINLVGSSPQVNTAGYSLAQFQNDGTINVTNPSGGFQSPIFNVQVVGTGSINMGANGKLDLRLGASSTQSLNFQGGVNGNSVVQIENVNSFNANINNFVSGNSLLVTNIPYTNATYTPNGNSGTLNLYSGGTLEGSLHFNGLYSLGAFSLQYQTLVGGGSDLFITTSVQNPSNGSSTSSTAFGPNYRFLDTTFGTHLFTQSVLEAQQILATRPDLHEETNNFGAVSPTAPSAEPIYRFNETSNGTHFFTASQAEFNAITTPGSGDYQPSFTYEAASTFYEDSVQQTGDVAVFRFRDTSTGTQFLTGSQIEAQAVTTPGSGDYQPHFVSEGVAFYAPAGTFFA